MRWPWPKRRAEPDNRTDAVKAKWDVALDRMDAALDRFEAKVLVPRLARQEDKPNER